MIDCFHVCKGWGCPLLRGVTFRIEAGESVCLSGPPGSGKTVLIKLLIGLLTPDSGQIFINGINLQQLSRKETACLRRRLGIVPQDFKLLMDRSVFDNVTLPLEILGKEEDFVHEKTYSILHALGLAEKASFPCHHLSWSEQYLVAVARSVVSDPLIVFVDEPTTLSGETTNTRVTEFLKHINDRGTTLFIVSRSFSGIDTFSPNRRLTIKDGLIIDEDQEII